MFLHNFNKEHLLEPWAIDQSELIPKDVVIDGTIKQIKKGNFAV